MSRIPSIQHKTESSYQRSTIPKPTGSRIARPTSSSTRVTASSVREMKPGAQKELAAVKPSDTKIQAPSLLQKRVFKQALVQSVRDPGKVVKATGMARSEMPAPQVKTKRGKECLMQQMVTETTVQRTPKAEYIGKTVIGVDVAPSGMARQIEMSLSQIDPTHGTESAGVNETVSVTSSLSVTSGGKQRKTSYKKKTLISRKLKDQVNMNPHHVNRLVIEEIEDVENTLKMVPPDLVSTSVEKFPLKKRLQKLRLNAEPISLLSQSVMHPTPTADEMEAEAPPEVVAEVMDAVERGATPEVAPNQIFASLFPDVQEPKVGVSSVAPGPFQDIIVPTEPAPKLFEEVLTPEMEEFISQEIQNKEQLPTDSICTDRNITSPERASKGEGKAPTLLEGELPPWESGTVNKLSSLVGGHPLYELEALDYSTIDAESPQNVSQELSKGIDYFVDADLAPYETKIQIRGSKMPKWFPGYMSAFPHLPELVKISRSPSEVLHTAWKAVQPKVFPEESLLIG